MKLNSLVQKITLGVLFTVHLSLQSLPAAANPDIQQKDLPPTLAQYIKQEANKLGVTFILTDQEANDFAKELCTNISNGGPETIDEYVMEGKKRNLNQQQIDIYSHLLLGSLYYHCPDNLVKVTDYLQNPDKAKDPKKPATDPKSKPKPNP